MRVHVTMASGDVDEWDVVDDAFVVDGSLQVLSEIEGDEISAALKTIEVTKDTEPTGTIATTYVLEAMYAPGMWIKVEFPAEDEE